VLEENNQIGQMEFTTIHNWNI